MATLYAIDGTAREVAPANRRAFTLDDLQALVGGYVEPVRGGSLLDDQVLLVDEDGQRKQLDVNEEASALVGRMIVGPAVLCRVTAIGQDDERWT